MFAQAAELTVGVMVFKMDKLGVGHSDIIHHLDKVAIFHRTAA